MLRNRSKYSHAMTQCGIVAMSFLMALLIGSILLLAEGENPLDIYFCLFVKPLTTGKGLIKVLAKVTPLIFAGLAVSTAFKCSVFNIGVEGQLYIGGLVAAVLGVSLQGLPSWMHILLCTLGAMIAGAVLAWIPAILKVKLNVHEVISTIMLNYAISSVIAFIVVNYFRSDGPMARTPYVAETARLSQFSFPELLNTGIIAAVILCGVLYFVFNRTPFGWRIEAAGKNLHAAKYSGMNSGRLIIITMMLSGAIAALVGVERVLGAYGYMEVNFSPGYGWDGITIAILAANNPIGVLLISCLLGLMSYGSTLVNIESGIPPEWVEILTALIFVFVVLGSALVKILETRRQSAHMRGGKA